MPNLVQISVIVTEINFCFRHSFDDVTRINFRFRHLVTWSSPHGGVGADIFIQSGVIDIFPKLKMAAATILDLLVGEPLDNPLRIIYGAYLL